MQTYTPNMRAKVYQRAYKPEANLANDAASEIIQKSKNFLKQKISQPIFLKQKMDQSDSCGFSSQLRVFLKTLL